MLFNNNAHDPYYRTLCTSGSGTGVCVELGDSTVFGRIAQAATRERPQKTTLEIEILRFVIISESFPLDSNPSTHDFSQLRPSLLLSLSSSSFCGRPGSDATTLASSPSRLFSSTASR